MIILDGYSGGSIVNLTSNMYSIGSAVQAGGSNYFYGASTVNAGSTNGDVCVDYAGVDIDSIRITYTSKDASGTITQDLGITNLEWCTSTPLPVTWLNIEAKHLDGFARVSWSTASEINNDFFSIESSSNGIDFTEIGKLPGSGTTSNVSTYVFDDYSPIQGVKYFRIKQTDFDGQFDYSPITVLAQIKVANGFTLSPNPVRSNMTVTFDKQLPKGVYQIRLVDLNGKILYQAEADKSGVNRKAIVISTDDMPTGIYFMHLIGSTTKHVQRVVLLHN
jgi:hypothetical protein